MTEEAPMPLEGFSSPSYDELTTTIVSAYVSNNAVPKAELPALIQMIRSALTANGGTPIEVAEAEPVKKLTPAEIKKSVTAAGIVSFIDGRTYQTLKRHLTKNGMTFAQYKARFGLPADYPVTSPAYSAKRSQIAKDIGLGVPGGRAAA